MDGSVKNLLQAEKQAADIIAKAQQEMQDKLLGAEATAQERVNVIQQRDLNKLMDQEHARVSTTFFNQPNSHSYHSM